MSKQRLDTLLAERGLFPSRSRAAASVMAGEVCVGTDGRRAQKPSEMVEADAAVTVLERPRFVSRGGTKLENALSHTGLPVAGRRALDVGCSTGGFTDCLLQHGAREVVAIDVGYGELHYGLRTDQRVQVLERTNARNLHPAMLPAARGGDGASLPDLAVVDVSFISLVKVLPAVLGCLTERHDVLALVKPQFELGRELVGRGRGVVRDANDRRAALEGVGLAALELGEGVLGYCSSGLPGPKGNRESFVWLAEPGRAGTVSGSGTPAARELERLAREVEP